MPDTENASTTAVNVVVAIGENFGASVRVVALLKQKKVPRIFARAIDAVHKAVLEALDRKSTRLNSSHITRSRMPSSA